MRNCESKCQNASRNIEMSKHQNASRCVDCQFNKCLSETSVQRILLCLWKLILDIYQCLIFLSTAPSSALFFTHLVHVATQRDEQCSYSALGQATEVSSYLRYGSKKIGDEDEDERRRRERRITRRQCVDPQNDGHERKKKKQQLRICPNSRRAEQQHSYIKL